MVAAVSSRGPSVVIAARAVTIAVAMSWFVVPIVAKPAVAASLPGPPALARGAPTAGTTAFATAASSALFRIVEMPLEGRVLGGGEGKRGRARRTELPRPVVSGGGRALLPGLLFLSRFCHLQLKELLSQVCLPCLLDAICEVFCFCGAIRSMTAMAGLADAAVQGSILALRLVFTAGGWPAPGWVGPTGGWRIRRHPVCDCAWANTESLDGPALLYRGY